MTRPFTQWCAATGAVEPDPEAVDALAEEWMGGRLPDHLRERVIAAATPHTSDTASR